MPVLLRTERVHAPKHWRRDELLLCQRKLRFDSEREALARQKRDHLLAHDCIRIEAIDEDADVTKKRLCADRQPAVVPIRLKIWPRVAKRLVEAEEPARRCGMGASPMLHGRGAHATKEKLTRRVCWCRHARLNVDLAHRSRRHTHLRHHLLREQPT